MPRTWNDELRNIVREQAEAALAAGRDLQVDPKGILEMLRLTDEIRAELPPLREDIAAIERQRDEAQARASILAAQLAGWEAQCAAQVEAARHLLDRIEPINLDADPELRRLVEVLAQTIDTDAGKLLLGKFEELAALVCGVRHYVRSHRLAIGECVAWAVLKRQLGAGQSDEEDDRRWNAYRQQEGTAYANYYRPRKK